MSIKIAAKLRPFSHTPGASCVIPKTHSILEAFPTLLRIDGKEWPLKLSGPVKGFTVQQDLEKDAVFVFGNAKEGYFRLRIVANDGGFDIVSERGFLKGGKIDAEIQYSEKTSLEIEKLSLGSHKAQDWDLMQRRLDLKELLPILFSLGQKIPSVLPQELSGTALLLKFFEKRDAIEENLSAFFRAAFKSMLVPRLIDDQHQGLVAEGAGRGNPFFLLQEGMKRVRSLFFSQNERRIAFLPNLPVSLDAGRLIGIQAPGIGEIDFEWSKKTMRRCLIRANNSGEILFDLPKEIRRFRVGRKKWIQREEPLLIEEKKIFLLDRFER